jgi:hypothetical protein
MFTLGHTILHRFNGNSQRRFSPGNSLCSSPRQGTISKKVTVSPDENVYTMPVKPCRTLSSMEAYEKGIV